jgi:sensor c-di-GMP phosphodiesterase-like protein
MRYRPRIAVVFVIGLVAVCAPTLASIYLAWYQSLVAQKALGLAYAHDALGRAESTASQFSAARQQLEQAGNAPCSPQEIDLLRQIDLGSSFIQAVGRISGDTLLCTSLGVTQPVDLGKPNLISAKGVAEYFNVKLSAGQSVPLEVFAAGDFAIIVNPHQTVSVPTEGGDIEVAVFVPSSPHHDRLATRGTQFQPQWFQLASPGAQSSFLDHGFYVTSVCSVKSDLAAVVAIPQHYIQQRVRHFALLFTPIGLLCGIVLGWAANYIALLRISFSAQIRRGIRNKEFFVEYQPIVELHSRRIIGAEALVRWGTGAGIVPPNEFIPLAEGHNLIHLITDAVLEIVRRDLPRLLKFDPNFEVALNLSAGDLRSGRTLEQLDRLLKATGAQPRNVAIEATERAFLHGPETAELIGALRCQGFRVAIDDFGTGYSSLACLQSLSLDTLKIDKAFVDTINTSGAAGHVVLHIIEMAHSLHLEMVAEGVETEAQASFLARRGVRYAQGWFFGKPMPVGRLVAAVKHAAAKPALTLV